MKISILAIALLTTALPAFAVTKVTATVPYELRLIPAVCDDQSSQHYLTNRCGLLRAEREKAFIECEVKRDGVLVRDEARNQYVCVKANPLPTDISLSQKTL